MLACAVAENCQSSDILDRVSQKIAASLGIFGGTVASRAFPNGRLFKGQLTRSSGIRSQPQRLPYRPSASGAHAVLTGEIDNLVEIARLLDVATPTADAVLAAAWDRWGDDLDTHLIGDYASVLVLPDGRLRLSRSPWRAPPLHFCRHEGITAIATTPRVLLAAGLPNRLNQRKLVDNLFLHLREEEGWYPGSYQVGYGCSVMLYPDGSRKINQFYDYFAQRTTRYPTREAYVEAADELLREACAKTLGDARQPGVFLSGGLDSSNVAARLAQCLPDGRRLKSFTWRPHPDFEEPPENSYYFGDDWPAVREFAAMHPGIEPFEARSEAFDDDWDKLFLAMSQAPNGMCNMALYGPVCRMASEQGCDLLLDAGWGNFTFSSKGEWAYSHFLLTGRWKQLLMGLAGMSSGMRQLPIAFACKAIGPFLPDFVWRAWRRLNGKSTIPAQFAISTGKREALASHGTLERAARTGYLRARWPSLGRIGEIHGNLDGGEMQSGDVTHGFEQVYGFRWRDVTAYRPFVEFCLGLPPELFVHDGQDRWLARELGRGLLPENQRTRFRYGFHNCDWHTKLTPQLGMLRAELKAAADDPDIGAILDFEKLDEIFESWPESVDIGDSYAHSHGMALPRAVLTKRYVEFVTGRNR